MLLLFHEVGKAMHGIGCIGYRLAPGGLPSVVCYGAFIGELVAPVFLLSGFWVAPAAAVVMSWMLLQQG